MNERTLTLEIGTEELPPASLAELAVGFADGLRRGLDERSLSFADLMHYASPRRLGVVVSAVTVNQQDHDVLKRGPALAVAYDNNGQATPATLGFASSCGANVDELEILNTDKGAWLAYRFREPGRPTIDLVPDILADALTALPIAKKMRWGIEEHEFVRPVHWILAIFGTDVVEFSMFGVKSGRQTFGHRFHHPQPLALQSADDYPQRLAESGWVIADPDRREELIRSAVTEAATTVNGRPLFTPRLLIQVNALVEWPVAILGAFDRRYLKLPKEVLMLTMQGHQRYFPVVDENDALLPYFVNVINIDSRLPETVRRGNERVLEPRLRDAEFFWRRDKATPLFELRESLANIVFQRLLGSLYDKSNRIENLVVSLAAVLDTDQAVVQRAARLCKCDLLTLMVAEWPELQGLMGYYYALEDGEPLAVAVALNEQYMPRYSGDHIPQSDGGRLLAIADKADTLVGIFAAGQEPSGDRDPFSLRRSALGVLRIIIEGRLPLDLWQCLQYAVDNYDPELTGDKEARDRLLHKVFDFMMERLRYYYTSQGIEADSFLAVAACRPRLPYDFSMRLAAVVEFRKLPQAEALVATNKRIANILKKAGLGSDGGQVVSELLSDDAEKVLAADIDAIEPEVTELLADHDYIQVLTRLADLKDAVDDFFNTVMVMCDADDQRNNRLALLLRLNSLFLRVADISKLQS